MITLSITSAGIPWSAADLARITPDPEAPLCSVQAQLEALGYRVTAIQGCGAHVSAEVEADVTDEQIRDLVRSTTDRELIAIGASALNPMCHEPRRTEARARCAAIIAAINARAEQYNRDMVSDADVAFDNAMARAALEHNLRRGGA